jgi:Protein of unknown function (DUF3761)
VANDTKEVAKKAGKETKDAAGAVAHDTKGAVKTTGKDTQNVGSAIKADATGDHKDATAKCGDDTYWYSVEQTGACKDHGGVAEWIKK